MAVFLVLIPALLLAGAILNGALAAASSRGRRVPVQMAGFVGVLAPVLAFVASFHVFARLEGAESGGVSTVLFQWFAAGDLAVDFKLGADPLGCVMLLVITGIGSLIHIYSLGYMKGDEGYARYFACLNLFTFFMALLVLAGNFLVLFVGWEGVGLCSYLLIGFWWTDETKAKAGMKAFVVNRIGDAGFLLGVLLVWKALGTIDFAEIRGLLEDPANRERMLLPAGFFGASVATMAGCLLFLGATGKSAQIPLYVWLPDAMAGPTPVSALIHAATMVTAGVYMVARLNFLFALTPFTQGLILAVAAVTSLGAGLMAMTQTDIKKVLAYSTISQIGYMMIGVATGNIAAGMFHVVTHAFFKASLFLGSGSVIAMNHHEQDMRRYGGLARVMPWTCAAMAVSAAAMAGVPPLSGFFSKDEILWSAFSSGSLPGRFAWLAGLLCALCTGFYMFRLIFMTFGGKYRGHHHPHEAPPVMTVPQGLLAAGAVLVGFLGVPHVLGGHNAFGAYLDPVIPGWARHAAAPHGPATLAAEWALLLWSVLVGLAGIAAAWWMYIQRPELPSRVAERIPGAYRLVHEKFRVDEFYERWIVSPVARFARAFCHELVDRRFIEGVVNGLGSGCRRLCRSLSLAQSGNFRHYVALMVAGLLLLFLAYLTSGG